MIVLYSEKNSWFKEKGLYLFDKPVKTAKYINNKLYINGKSFYTKNPLPVIEKIIKNHKLFALGFISYNYKEKIFGKKPKYDNLRLPDIYVAFYKNFKKYTDSKSKISSRIKSLSIKTDESQFIDRVKKAKEYIESGDIYQVNLSHRIEVEGFFHPESVFLNLLKVQPAPYLMLIKEKDFSLVSGSMELFLEKNAGMIITKPIKGTRKRGKDNEEDIKLFRELESSKKEKAENLMITDLMRNDIGRVAKNIYVENPFNIEKYNSLFQMVTTVKGKVKDTSLKDFIHSTFPPGSVTGAPKKRALEIIDELEDCKRSIYCGANFFIKPDLDFVMSVAIRQMIFKGNKCYIYVGSGIVSDSNPVKEYEETILKAKASLEALKL